MINPVTHEVPFTPTPQQIGEWIANAYSDEQADILIAWQRESQQMNWCMQSCSIAGDLRGMDRIRVTQMLKTLIAHLEES